MARALFREWGLAHLDLDHLGWESPGVRRSADESGEAVRAFVQAHHEWVIEGCYANPAFLLDRVGAYETRSDEPSLP